MSLHMNPQRRYQVLSGLEKSAAKHGMIAPVIAIRSNPFSTTYEFTLPDEGSAESFVNENTGIGFRLYANQSKAYAVFVSDFR